MSDASKETSCGGCRVRVVGLLRKSCSTAPPDERAMTLATNMTPPRMNRWPVRGLRALVSVGLLIWLIRSIDWHQSVALLPGLRWAFVLYACAMPLGNTFLSLLRWQTLLGAKGFVFSNRYLLRVIWISNFFGDFIPLPGTLGVDNIRL